MNTRRKFIINSSLTAVALVATNPFKALAGSSGFFQTSTGRNYIVLMHTTGLQKYKHQATLGFIHNIQSKTSNTLMIDAADNSTGIETKDYQVIRKGGVNTGIIYATTDETGLAERLNNLAAYLKKEKNCQVVVCISQLGYKNKNKIDDCQLAAASANTDIIIGIHTDNFTKHPMVLHDSNGHEIILQSASATDAGFGKIEIGFDSKGRKNHIHILNTVPEKHQQQQEGCIVAA